MSLEFVRGFLAESKAALEQLDAQAIEAVARGLGAVRDGGGRLFILGVGGSAGHASHAVNDFRKLAHIETYAPTDNVSELTARTNDEGWDTVFSEWLTGSRIGPRDMVLVFSVGGGDTARNVSRCIVRGLETAHAAGATIGGIVGRDGGFTATVADACVIVPTITPETVTPHTESFQAVVWHLLVSHPDMKVSEMKWESVK